MSLFGQTTVDALSHTMAFAQRRHEVLAGNLANLDTPGYRSRDLDVEHFQSVLADHIRHGSSSVEEGVPVTTRDDRRYGPREASEQIVFHDDSDVSLESQVTEISKNQGMHALAVATLRSQFSVLRAAITERV